MLHSDPSASGSHPSISDPSLSDSSLSDPSLSDSSLSDSSLSDPSLSDPSLSDPSLSDLVDAHRAGDEGVLDELVSRLYRDLRRLAHFELLRLRPWEPLDTTALVNEAYLKIAAQKDASWRGRSHFLAASAKAMRHILVDAARRRLSQKGGGGQQPETWDDRLCGGKEHAEEVLAVDQALGRLRELDERMAQVVECQFFAGFSKEETAEALRVSVRTVHRDWQRAKGWLRKWLASHEEDSAKDVTA